MPITKKTVKKPVKKVVKKEVEEIIENEVEVVEGEYIDYEKKVMDRETGEIIIIDERTEPKWQTKYLHCSGCEFNA